MLGPKIFKRDTNGNIRVWHYEVQGETWRSYSGIVGGAVVESGWTTCTPKSRPTAAEQALFEAEAEMGKKLDKDYALTEAGVDEERSFGRKVMLAEVYQGVIPVMGAFSQPKLDGMRCKVNRHGMWSRTGKPILSCPHIFAILAPAFAGHPDLEFDGELYNHELRDDFPKLMSMLRKSEPNEDALKHVQYHVYDLVLSGQDFEQRDATLDMFVINLGAPEIVKVPTVPVLNIEQVDRAYGTYLEQGYEGQMVRINGPYEHKRSKLLLKRKEFETREFKLISIEEGNGNWAGLAKKVVFELEDGRPCGAGIRGNAEAAKRLLEGPKPGIVTIRSFARSPDGVPRFPVAIDFDRPDAA
jgi:DNA ligase-1